MTDRAAPARAKKTDPLRWIVWPVVALVVVLLATFEILPMRRAAATANAWRAALDGTGETEAFRVSALDRHVSGSPARSEIAPAEATLDQIPVVEKTLVYTWSGLFRKHVVRVHVSRGQDPEVEAVDGP
jgi:hypothetical protein